MNKKQIKEILNSRKEYLSKKKVITLRKILLQNIKGDIRTKKNCNLDQEYYEI